MSEEDSLYNYTWPYDSFVRKPKDVAIIIF